MLFKKVINTIFHLFFNLKFWQLNNNISPFSTNLKRKRTNKELQHICDVKSPI